MQSCYEKKVELLHFISAYIPYVFASMVTQFI